MAEKAEDYAQGEFDDIDVSNVLQDQFVAGKVDYIDRLAVRGPEEMVFVAEFAETPEQTMLGCWLVLMGTDGYNALTLETAWNSRPDPSWGTLFGPQVPIGDCRPDFVFKVCHDSKYRVLAVECGDAPLSNEDRLLENGVHVVRFTNKYIAVDTEACADEINLALSNMADELLAERGPGPTPWLDGSMTPIGKRRSRR